MCGLACSDTLSCGAYVGDTGSSWADVVSPHHLPFILIKGLAVWWYILCDVCLLVEIMLYIADVLMYTLVTQKVIQNYYQNSQEEEQLVIKRFLCIVASYLKPNIYDLYR